MWNKFTQLTVSWRWHILWPREVVVWQELLDCSFPKLHPVLSPASFSTAVSPTSASPLWLISGVWIPLWLCCHERDFSYLVLKSNPWPEKAKGGKNPKPTSWNVMTTVVNRIPHSLQRMGPHRLETASRGFGSRRNNIQRRKSSLLKWYYKLLDSYVCWF